jgi:hypothetical protein
MVGTDLDRHKDHRHAGEAGAPGTEAVVGKATPAQRPVVVLRAHYEPLRAVLAATYPPLCEMGDPQRREFHEALLDADAFEDLPGRWQAAIVRARSRTVPTFGSSEATLGLDRAIASSRKAAARA